MKPEVVFKDKELVQRLESERLAFFHVSGSQGRGKGAAHVLRKESGWEGYVGGRGKERCKEMERFYILSCSLHDPLDPADKGGA